MLVLQIVPFNLSSLIDDDSIDNWEVSRDITSHHCSPLLKWYKSNEVAWLIYRDAHYIRVG